MFPRCGWFFLSSIKRRITQPLQAESLQFLDLSQNPLDKKSIEFIVAALATAPTPGLVSLRLDDCSLRPSALETLCKFAFYLADQFVTLTANKLGPFAHPPCEIYPCDTTASTQPVL